MSGKLVPRSLPNNNTPNGHRIRRTSPSTYRSILVPWHFPYHLRRSLALPVVPRQTLATVAVTALWRTTTLRMSAIMTLSDCNLLLLPYRSSVPAVPPAFCCCITTVNLARHSGTIGR